MLLTRFYLRARSKTALRLVTGRIRLLSNKKAQQLKLLSAEIGQLLAAGKNDSARIRVRAVGCV